MNEDKTIGIAMAIGAVVFVCFCYLLGAGI